MPSEDLFNRWAADYDLSVAASADRYPFKDYYDVLLTVLNRAAPQKADTVLDIGIGTGVLSKSLYDRGCEVVGVDFSQAMLERARERMRGLHAVLHDIVRPLPDTIRQWHPTCAVSSYALHHLTLPEKVSLIAQVVHDILPPGARFVIGDIGFETHADLEQCRLANLKYWDDDEYYMVAEELVPALGHRGIMGVFTVVGECAGVLACSAVAWLRP